MVEIFKVDGREIIVNNTDSPIAIGSYDDEKDILSTGISWLATMSDSEVGIYRFRKGNTDHKRDVIKTTDMVMDFILDKHMQGRILLSPGCFIGNIDYLMDKHLPYFVAERFVQGTALGRSLEAELGPKGVHERIAKQKSDVVRGEYRRGMTIVFASLCGSIYGAKNITELPLEPFLCWLNYFRDREEGGWRRDALGSDKRTVSCLKQVALAYSRLTGFDVAEAVKRRPAVPSKWKDIENNPSDHLVQWVKLFIEWRDTMPAIASKYNPMFFRLVEWLNIFPQNKISDVREFMINKYRDVSFYEYIASNNDLAASSCMDAAGKALSFSEFIAKKLSDDRVFYHLVTDNDLAEARNRLKAAGGGRRVEAVSRPLPIRLYRLTQEILSEGEAGWPGTLSVCHSTVIGNDGVATTVYCPVYPTLFLALFEIPLRVGQMKRLDSGEGDVDRFDGSSLSWGRNDAPSAGYWRKEDRKWPNRGYAHRAGTPPITGFAINTNKTGQPYVVPWQNERLHRMLYELRLWQERYNPIARPIVPTQYVDAADKADEGKLENDYPDIFPLFRLPVHAANERAGCPPSGTQTYSFWQKLMVEVETRWNRDNPDDRIEIVPVNEKGVLSAPKYNPHGLRVAGLTLMVQAKVPIEVISKLIAGHKTILMTLYYIKADPASVHEALETAAQSKEAAMIAASLRDLKAASFEQAQRKAAVISEDGLLAATQMDASGKMLWSDTGLGICPWDGERCSDGGPRLRKNTVHGVSKDVYAPVEGGEGNCILCRHFISGPAWRTPLWLYGTKLTRQLASKSQRMEELQEEVVRLREGAAEGDGRRIAREIERREGEMNRLGHDRELLGNAIWNVFRLLEICDGIEASPSPDGQTEGVALIAHDRSSVVEFVEVSEFEQAAIITAASRIYPVLHDQEAEASRDHFLNSLLWNSGGTPLAFAPLSDEAKRRGFDALAKLILQRAEREEIRAFASKALRLQDIGLEGEAAAVLSSAVGQPFMLSAKPRDPFRIGRSEPVG
ncbi:VPA1269 family protein [Methylosinus sp. KRF6]|uniref:VPA1269 family protein n=1 Tax=Methylosinus sp. KRF6 TaxID=2846853 RepID=UPI001C0D71BA|nr:VPA1269 family protein [Methylosinus sp. KRF6]MBU3891007.1 hypothetical protein [Methylosinus sp. KRF6]